MSFHLPEPDPLYSFQAKMAGLHTAKRRRDASSNASESSEGDGAKSSEKKAALSQSAFENDYAAWEGEIQPSASLQGDGCTDSAAPVATMYSTTQNRNKFRSACFIRFVFASCLQVFLISRQLNRSVRFIWSCRQTFAAPSPSKWTKQVLSYDKRSSRRGPPRPQH